MATSGLGASNTHVLSLKVNLKTDLPCFPHGIQVGSRPKAWNHTGVGVSWRTNKALVACQSPPSLIAENETASSSPLKKRTEKKSVSSPVGKLIPRKNEVIHLLKEICDTTSIADFELKLNGFYLHVRRSQSGGVDPQPPPQSPSVSASISAEAVEDIAASNDSVSATSLAITKAWPLEVDNGALMGRAADEGLVIIQSPRVGFFRRSRTIKGKRTPPSCKEKQVVKEGQVICYVEQLGGEMPVESDVSGEVIRILREDGEPVGYGDPIIAILPSFPGINT